MDSHISYPEIVKRILHTHATFYSQGSRWPLRTVFDDTEQGVAGDLLEAGVGKDDIVLGFRPPDLRQYTSFTSVDTPVASRDRA